MNVEQPLKSDRYTPPRSGLGAGERERKRYGGRVEVNWEKKIAPGGENSAGKQISDGVIRKMFRGKVG